jgi:hypothetical protein
LIGFRYRLGQSAVLNVIADGERFRFELPILGQENLYAYMNVLGSNINYSDFRKIALAKKVEMRLDADEFVITVGQSATFHDFLKHFWMTNDSH